MSDDVRVHVAREMDVGRAVVAASTFAKAAGFDEARSQMISTAVSELTRNILKYAGSGEVWLRRVELGRERGIEVEASDAGPGIADADEAMTDHFSSSGTLGMGLPGVKRLMDEFHLESTLDEGTCVTARKWI